jgi:membrane-associated phospholipid phosphatase
VEEGSNYRQLFVKTRLALLVGAAVVALCYFFVDRPVAFAIASRDHSWDPLLKGLTKPPPIVQAWVPVLLIAAAVRRLWGPLHRWERTLVTAGVAIVLADQFKQTLAYVFGRYWPETWTDNNTNPSLIGDGAYGFHPFHWGNAYNSFPSGNTARTVALAAVIWLVYPWWRWACVVATLAVAVGLVGMNYHFVGDVVGGAFVGGVVGVFAVHVAGLRDNTPGGR